LRRPDAAPGPAARQHPRLGLLLPDLGLDDKLRLVLRRRAKREDHVGQTRGGHPEIHRRIRRIDRRTADVRLYFGMVAAPILSTLFILSCLPSALLDFAI